MPVLEASILKAFTGKLIWLRCTESPSPVSLSRTHRLSLPPRTQFSRYIASDEERLRASIGRFRQEEAKDNLPRQSCDDIPTDVDCLMDRTVKKGSLPPKPSRTAAIASRRACWLLCPAPGSRASQWRTFWLQRSLGCRNATSPSGTSATSFGPLLPSAEQGQHQARVQVCT